MDFKGLLGDIKEETELIAESVVRKDGKYFAYRKNGQPIGNRNGYDNAKEAVRTFYSSVLSTFSAMTLPKQDEIIEKYIKRQRIKGHTL
jgi:hypothetical protein